MGLGAATYITAFLFPILTLLKRSNGFINIITSFTAFTANKISSADLYRIIGVYRIRTNSQKVIRIKFTQKIQKVYIDF